MAEVTRDDLREYLQQVGPSEGNNLLLDKALLRAKAIANDYLALRFGKSWPGFGAYTTGTTKQVYGWGTEVLVLPPHQLSSVTAVTLGGTPVINWAEDANGDLVKQYAGSYFPVVKQSWGRWIYLVTANWGYGPTPDSVNQVYLELAVNIWRGRDRGMWTDTIGEQGQGALQFTGGLTSQQRLVLDSVVRRYRTIAGTSGVNSPWNENDAAF